MQKVASSFIPAPKAAGLLATRNCAYLCSVFKLAEAGVE